MSAKKKILVAVTNDISTDQRVRKVCEFLVENSFEVTLIGRKLPNSVPLPKLNYKTRRFNLIFKKGPLFYATYNLRLFFYLLFRKADCLLANDLDTLYANVWAKKFKSNCRLFYDSHELYCETPELIHRPRIQKIWKRIERKCIPKVDSFYTVNESIAEIYSKEYGKDVKVVRNIGDALNLELNETRESLGLPTDKKIVILQGAGINIDRGAEELVNAIQMVENAVLVIVGDGDVVASLKKTVTDNAWEQKVMFFDKRTYSEMMNFTKLADVGVSLDKDSNLNYRYSLGNKIFDYIHARIPLFVSDLPEIARIVRQYKVGVIALSHDPKQIAEQLNNLFSDEEAYQKLKSNTHKAAAELNWENEKKMLQEIYIIE